MFSCFQPLKFTNDVCVPLNTIRYSLRRPACRRLRMSQLFCKRDAAVMVGEGN